MAVGLFRFDPEESKAWDEYVLGHPDSGHSHLCGWGRVIERSYGHRPFYLWTREVGGARGILPLVLIESRLFGNALVSLPFLDDGGICADNDRVRDELCQAAQGLFAELGVGHLEFRHRRPSGLDLSAHGAKVTMTLALSDHPDRMWERFDAKIRNQIRKASKSGLTACWSGPEGLPGFYDVFAANMRDLGSPVHGRAFFAEILKEFSESARLILVQKDGRTVGAGLCLLFKQTMMMPWASSRREFLSSCPNNLLYWEAIRWGCEQGYRRFDFGRSSRDSGTYHFKKQWGAVEEPLHWQSFGRNGGGAPTPQAEDRRYRWAVRAWKRLPLVVANRIGPMVRRQMSH